MPSSRRNFLSVAGLSLAFSLSGCLSEGSRSVSLSVSNTTQEQQSLFIEILPADIEKNLSENALFAEWIDIGKNDESYTVRQNVFDSQRALVRVKNSRGYIGQYTFIPDCPEDPGEHIEVTLHTATTVTISQNWCRT